MPAGRAGQPPTLASAGDDGTVRLWDLATGQPAAPPLTGHTAPICSVCVVSASRPGQPATLASIDYGGTVRLWDLATGQPAAPPFAAHTGPVWGMCVVPASRPGQPPILASAGYDGTVRLWDSATGQPAAPPLTGHSGLTAGVCVVPASRPGQSPTLASAGGDGTVRLWDPFTGRAAGKSLAISPAMVDSLAPCAAAVTDCVTVHGDGTVRTWTAATAAFGDVTCPPDVCAIATVNSAGQAGLITGDIYGQTHHSHLATGCQAGPPLLIDNRAVLAICPLPGPPARSAADRVAAAGGSGTITIITVLPGGQLEPGPVLTGPHGPIRTLCLASHPDGRTLLAAAGNDATIWIWDLATIDAGPPDASTTVASLRGPLTGHDGWIWALTAIPETPSSPPRLASAGADHTIRLWDPVTGHALGPPLTGHTSQVRALITATSHDGRTILVSGGHDGTIRLWDVTTGTPGAVIPLGIPVHALLQQPADPSSQQRTCGGATITVGLRTGILTLDLHHDLFAPTLVP